MKRAASKSRQRVSAGLLMYRIRNGELEVFLAHPGGPYFTNKYDGHWSIPKGELEPGEEMLAAAQREFQEEVGIASCGEYIPLGSIRQKGGKIVHAWAFRGEWADDQKHQCNTFRMEWPPRSGKFIQAPEIDQVGFFKLPEARIKMKETQHPFLERLAAALGFPFEKSQPELL